jgi:hypothetical protein
MSDDLVKRLRRADTCIFPTERDLCHCGEAADRILKLEAALRVYAEEDHWFGDKFEPITFPEGECVCCYEHFSDQGEIARKALDAK